MRRCPVHRRSGAVLLLCAFTAACGGSARTAKAPSAAAANVRPLDVTDQSFADEAAALFRSGEPSDARASRLSGVVRYQLGRAAALYDAGHEEAGLRAVEGALYLVRVGEFHPSMVEGRTAPLLAAANAVSRTGSEGRALALYSILTTILPPGPDKEEVQAHLTAIQQWMEKTRSRGPLQAAGGDQRSATLRALWDPSHDALRAARAATLGWMERAVTYSKEQMPPTNEFERDEAIEAYQAVRTGAMALAALYLRNGNPAGALEAMEAPNVARFVSPHLHEALRRAAEDDDPAAWLELFSTFERAAGPSSDVGLEPELSQAASWGAALELCRVEPKTLRGVMPLATLLMRHGMAEVGPLLLDPVVEASGRAEVASWALGYVLEALATSDRVGDLASARRTFAHAAPLLAFVEQRSLAEEVSPTVPRVRLAMGALEARAGELAAARPLVADAARKEPNLAALELLSAIDRQRGSAVEALSSLESVVKLATESSDPTTVADARAASFEILRDMGKTADARVALEQALRRALDARKLARTGVEQASAERVLARVLEHYGDLAGAERASQRAYDAARNDQRQITAMVLESTRRGLVRGDLRAARAAVRRGLESNLPDDDLVYAAIWLRLLERHMTVPSDGTVEEAFARIDDTESWAGKLRSWCTGRLTDEQLYSAARSRAEQTEATFYAAMGAYAAGGKDASERLERVARSEAIELVEVGIARDLVAARRPIELKIPADVDVP